MAVKLGPYELLVRLSSSASANVFLARGAEDDLATVEVLRPNFASLPEHVGRLFRRASAGAGPPHPNIVKTIAFSQINGVHCLVCEHVFGVRLSEVLAMRPLPIEVAQAVMTAAVRAVEHPKTARIPSLTAENVVLAFDGAVKLYGFEEDPRPDRAVDAAALVAIARQSAPALSARIAADAHLAAPRELLLLLGRGARADAIAPFLAGIFGHRIREGRAALSHADEATLASALGGETVNAKEIPSIPGGATKPDLLGLYPARIVPQQAMTGIEALPVRRMHTPAPEAKTEIAPLPVRIPAPAEDTEATLEELPSKDEFHKIVEDLEIERPTDGDPPRRRPKTRRR